MTTAALLDMQNVSDTIVNKNPNRLRLRLPANLSEGKFLTKRSEKGAWIASLYDVPSIQIYLFIRTFANEIDNHG